METNSTSHPESLEPTNLIGSTMKEEPFLRRNISKLHHFFLRRFKDGEQIYLFLLALIVGVLMGIVASGFRWLVTFAHHLFFEAAHHKPGELFNIPSDVTQTLVKISLPAIGGLIVGFVIYKIFKLHGGHGVPSVMKAIATGNMNLSPSMALKSSSSAVTITSGGSCGPEGPIIEIGSVVGSTVGRHGQVNKESVGTLIGCGAASGVAAFFNAPFGGAFLAIELLMRDFAIRTFGPIMIAAVVAHVTSESILPHQPLFYAAEGRSAVSNTLMDTIQTSGIQVLMFAVLGVLTGLAGTLLVVALYRAHDFFQKIAIPVWLKPALGGLGVGVIGIFFPDVIGEGYEFVNSSILSEYSSPSEEELSLLAVGLFLFVALVKTFVTSLTLGSGGTGGSFAPAMIVGATVGASLGVFCNAYLPTWSPSVPIFALVGMAGTVSASLGIPIAAILIVYEIAGGDYRLVLPLMVCASISALISAGLRQGSVYTLSLLRDGFDVEEELRRVKDPLTKLEVSKIMNRNFAKLAPQDQLSKVLDVFTISDDDAFPVVDENDQLQGIISASDLRGVLNMGDLGGAIIAADAADPNPRVLYPDSPASDALSIFSASDISGIPILEHRGSRKIVGLVGRVEVLTAYRQTIKSEGGEADVLSDRAPTD